MAHPVHALVLGDPGDEGGGGTPKRALHQVLTLEQLGQGHGRQLGELAMDLGEDSRRVRLEEQLPQPTRAPPQPIPILKCVQSPCARASQSSISSP